MGKIDGTLKVMKLTLQTLVSFDFGAIKMLPFWLSTLRLGRNPLDDKTPRLSISAISWLKKNISKKDVLFEYGSGGSTLFFSQLSKKIVSIEHDKMWYAKIKKEIEKNKFSNCDYRFVPPIKGRNPAYASTKEKGMDFKKYVLSINEFPDGFFDFVLVDGRARNACLSACIKKVKKGSYLILDNSERSEYRKGMELLSRFKRTDFISPAPYLSNNMAKTTVWHIV
jgi:hypothetical protein